MCNGHSPTPTAQVSVRRSGVTAMICNGRGRWPKPTALDYNTLVWESLTGIISVPLPGTYVVEGFTLKHTSPLIYNTPVTRIRVGPPGYFTHISITTTIASALKNYYI